MTLRPNYNIAIIIHYVLMSDNPARYDDLLDTIAIEIGQTIPPLERLQDIIDWGWFEIVENPNDAGDLRLKVTFSGFWTWWSYWNYWANKI